ncbi:hypothetical protein CAPTEDRAFT_208109 [Capitella teleta]|uniref:Uncharacterized protein n=1 Tax=Capitella teleta TaxID=283909 RepID=R7URM4_CAPTE|nr:hypothetical protein CAPTEDRAFT_208109 [Capitella teleta]|eukprot:ELU08803.1 hypothetical protein CAPTEDRAFT_208109 [Capitella teleta]
MAKLPILQEVGTAFVSLGDLITGNPKKAGQRWENYAEESVIGSGAASLVCLIANDKEKAKEYAKGMGRATGQAVLGGGLLENIPVFQEISTTGKALGDLIGGGDTESAAKRYEDYIENSMIGATVGSVVARVEGDDKRAEELIKNAGKAILSAGMTGGAIGLTVLTGGLAAPLGTAVSMAAGATVGAASSATTGAVDQALYNDGEIDAGALVGGAIMGGATGAYGGYKQAKGYQKLQQNKADGQKLSKSSNEVKKAVEDNKDKFSSKKAQQEKVVHTKMVAEDGKEASGFNNKARSRIDGPIKDPKTGEMVPSGNVKGGPAYPNGTPNVDEIAKKPSVQKALAKTGGENRVLHNCAEPHALENLKADHPNAVPKANYTVEYKHSGETVVKGPCGNCSAMSPGYGEVPFAKYDGVPCKSAIASHIKEGVQAVSNAATQAAVVLVPCTVYLSTVTSRPHYYVINENSIPDMPMEFVVFIDETVPEYVYKECKRRFRGAKALIRGSLSALRSYSDFGGVIRVAMGRFDADAASAFIREIGSRVAVVFVQLDCGDFGRISTFITRNGRTLNPSVYGVCQGKETKTKAVCERALSALGDLCTKGRNSYRRRRLLKEPAIMLK